MSDPLRTTLHPLARRFRAGGHALLLVGGSVRDRLLDRAEQDFDLATDAPPEVTRRLLAAAGADAVWAVGERFGTVAAKLDGIQVEVTTFRGETPGAFADTIEADLSRRDFTINAMAIDLECGRLVDPFGGETDLKAGVIRAVGDPRARFLDDPLRLLRAIRFAAQFGFRIEPETLAAIRALAPMLERPAVERVAVELNKLLLSERPEMGIRLLVDAGLAAHVLPELLPLRGTASGGYRHKDVFEHTLRVLRRLPPRLALRWAGLLHDIAKPRTFSVEDGEVRYWGHEAAGAEMARAILARLRLDHATIERVAHLVANHGYVNSYDSDWTDSAVRRLIREAGDTLDDLLALSAADVTSQREERVAAARARVEELAERIRRIQAEADVAKLTSPLDGHDLMRLFNRPPGPWIGRIKHHLTQLVVDGTLAPDDTATAEAIARQMLAEAENERTGER